MGFTEPLTFVFFGRSGAGKGTQAQKLADFLKKNDPDRSALYIGTGQLFRNFIDRHDSYASQRVEEVLSEGGLLPAFLPIWMWSNFLASNFTGSQHLIFDGVSRRPVEAPILSEALKFLRRRQPTVIYIDVSREWCVNRLTERGRNDDTAEDINHRLDWYEENTFPAIETFKQDDYFKFLTINGEQSIEEVYLEVLNKAGLD